MSGNVQEEFNNCRKFRTSLYFLRERLLAFLRERFTRFMRGLPDNSNSFIKQTIKDKVRTIDPVGRSLQYNANQRIERIEALSESEFTADWRTFATCYTRSFLARNHTWINHSNVDEADPRDLLEIIKNCSLFSDDLSAAAYVIITNNRRYYEHLSELLIDSDTFEYLILARERFLGLLSA